MKSRDLLSKLSVLESLLHDFSYEELNGKEASYLKKSFESFKTDLENLVYGQFDSLGSTDDQVGPKEKVSISRKEGKGSATLDVSSVPMACRKQELISGMQVLIFEDNHLSQRLIDLQLTQCQCKTFVTDKPQIGLKILEENHIDAILMDLRMPLMSGFEIAQLIRNSNDNRIAGIPIIAISADISLRDEEKCRTSGMDDFILKPYSVEELSLKLAKHAKREIKIDQNQKPQKESGPDVITAIDITGLLEECDDDIALLEDLVVLFKQNSIEFIEVAKTATTNSDRETLKFAAHKIKNGLAMLNARGLREIALKIYDGCSAEMPWEALRSLCDQYAETYPVVEKVLENQLNELRRK